MSVREKVDICQFEWYRDNEFVFITVSSIELGAVFYTIIAEHPPCIHIDRLLCFWNIVIEKENKNMKKRVFAVILGSVMAVSLMACGTKDEGAKDGTKTYTVGISQFAEHGSLDNCREGFIEGLKEAGFEEGKNLEIKEENAAADQGTAKQISDGFVSDDVDLICGIATPSAQSAYNSAMNTEIPVIYTAVTRSKSSKVCQ